MSSAAEESIQYSDSGDDVEIINHRSASTASSSRKSTSDVYTFVKEDPEDEFKPFYCSLCAAKNKNHRWKSRNTGNFRYHLIKEHGDVYTVSDPKQTKLQYYFSAKPGLKKRGRPTGFDFTVSDKTHADKKLVDWIVNHAQPFTVVEQDDFVEFSLALRPEYQLPSRNTVRAKILERWADEKKRVRMKLSQDVFGTRCGVTTDMWTSAAKRGYMVITLHYIDEEWVMKSVIVAFKRVLYPHSGVRLGEHFIEAVKEMDPILLCSIWAVTADNASNNPTMIDYINSNLEEAVKKCMEESTADEASAAHIDDPWTSCGVQFVFLIACFAHTIQLAIKEGLQQCKKLDAAIGRFRDLAKKISDSPKLLEALMAVCSSLKNIYSSLDLDVETRWNSTWEMLSDIISLKPSLEELLRRIRGRHEGYTDFCIAPTSLLAEEIPNESWCAVEDFCKFLAPFKEATVLMSGSTYPTLGLAVPVFFMIKQHVKRAITAEAGFTSTHTIKFAKAVLGKLNEYEDKIRGREVLIAAALDPRVKSLLQKIGVDKNMVKQYIVEEFETFYESRYKMSKSGSSGRQNKDNNQCSKSMMDMFLDILNEEDGSGGDKCDQIEEELFTNEVDRWFSHTSMALSQSSREVCIWFKVSAAVLFPRIAFMARDFLGVTATSVPSECAFSKSGSLVTKRRARLGDDAVQAICELQSFRSFLE